MHSIVRNTLEIYLREKRIITPADIASDVSEYSRTKDAVFVTLYLDGRVIASSGRIVAKKENTLFECIDNTLLCLKDERFAQEIQDIENLGKIHIRTDRFSQADRRVLQDISQLDTKTEWLIFLSQNLWKLSVILPNMLHIDNSPQAFFRLACKKSGLDPDALTPSDFVLYGLRTKSETDFEAV